MLVDLKERKLLPANHDSLYGVRRVEHATFDKEYDRVEIILTECINSGSVHSLPYLWHKGGYINRILPSYWNIDVYVHSPDGCYCAYNPMIKGRTLDFNWVIEATEENAIKIIEEIIARARS